MINTTLNCRKAKH